MKSSKTLVYILGFFSGLTHINTPSCGYEEQYQDTSIMHPQAYISHSREISFFLCDMRLLQTQRGWDTDIINGYRSGYSQVNEIMRGRSATVSDERLWGLHVNNYVRCRYSLLCD